MLASGKLNIVQDRLKTDSCLKTFSDSGPCLFHPTSRAISREIKEALLGVCLF